MKLITGILAVLFLGLSLIPCDDAGSEENEHVTILDGDLDHDHSQEPDLCSPFCVCHCCHTHFATYDNFYDGLPSLPFVIQITGYAVFFPKGYHPPIYQPPRA